MYTKVTLTAEDVEAALNLYLATKNKKLADFGHVETRPNGDLEFFCEDLFPIDYTESKLKNIQQEVRKRLEEKFAEDIEDPPPIKLE